MLSLVFIVGAHDGPCAALLNGGFKRREVDLVQRTVVDLDVDAVTVGLLVIECEMFHAGKYFIVALHIVSLITTHIRFCH